MNYSGATKRFFAFAIDCTVLIVCYVLLGLALGISFFSDPITTIPLIGFWFFGGVFCVAWIYHAAFESSKWQGTVGKKLFGLKVVDLEGNRVSFGRATARYYGKLLSRILMIGYLMVLWTKKKQALHDKIASTLVVRA